MNENRIRDIDAVDVVLLIVGMVAGGLATHLLTPAVSPLGLGATALACGVIAIQVRRAFRRPSPDGAKVEPPLVGARSLLFGVLVGVGGLILAIGLIVLAVVIGFLASPEPQRASSSTAYLLLPAVLLAVGAGAIAAGRRYRRR
jgi:hypothetical protein